MPTKPFRVGKYAQRVKNVIDNDGPDTAILSLLRDKRLKAYDDKLRRRCEESDIPDKEAFRAFTNSPRGKLIKYIKALPLAHQLRLAIKDKLRLAIKDKEVVERLSQNLAEQDKQADEQRSFSKRRKDIETFLKAKNVPYPIQGLQLDLQPDGWYQTDDGVRQRTGIWLKIHDGLRGGEIRKRYKDIEDVQRAVAEYDGLLNVDRLPHPLQAIAKQSRRFGGKWRDGRIAKDLNISLTETMTDFICNRQRNRWHLGFYSCSSVLASIMNGDHKRHLT